MDSDDIILQYYQIIRNKLSVLNFESALASANKLVACYPQNSNVHYYRGLCNFTLEKYPEAISDYANAIKFDITNAKAYFNIGVTYYLTNDYDSALINIAKALIIFTKRKELDCKKRCSDALYFIQAERKSFS